MRNNSNLHDDDFFEDAAKTQRKLALLGFGFFLVGLTFLSLLLYFFLAAAGVVPPHDVIPVVPYV